MNENIFCEEPTAAQTDSSFEIIFLEKTLRNGKRLITGLYKPPNQKGEYFFKILVWLSMILFQNTDILSYILF